MVIRIKGDRLAITLPGTATEPSHELKLILIAWLARDLVRNFDVQEIEIVYEP